MPNTLTRRVAARPLSLLVYIIIGCSLAIAQDHTASSIQLIPKPRQIAVKPDVFRVSTKTRIVLADPRSEEDHFAAEDFSSDVQETAKLAIEISFQRQARTLASQVREMRLAVENVDESLLRNETKARRNRSMISVMRFAAQRFDHLGRRMQVVRKFSQDYWDAYLNLGDRAKVGRLRNYWGNIYNSLREMTEELTMLREGYRRQWLG